MVKPGNEPMANRMDEDKFAPMIRPVYIFVDPGSTYTHEHGWHPTEPRHYHIPKGGFE